MELAGDNFYLPVSFHIIVRVIEHKNAQKLLKINYLIPKRLIYSNL